MFCKKPCPNYTFIRLIFQQGIYAILCRLLPVKKLVMENILF